MKKHLLIICFFALSSCAAGFPKATDGLLASRAFTGPGQFPPAGFAAYGILAFPASPELDPERFQIFCRAFLGSLVSSDVLVAREVPHSRQMVTVIPISSSTAASELIGLNNDEACNAAISNYGLDEAQSAIAFARAASLTDGQRELSGRGPFLLAWSPGSNFGSPDTLVLAADLSNTSSENQARSDMRIWIRDIQENSAQWRNGWSVEGVRLIAQRWVDRRGREIMRLIGEWG